MFSWANLEEHPLETPGEQLLVKGHSTAARGTSFNVTNRGILLDSGIPSDYRPGIIVLTHMHYDHVSDIVRYLFNEEQNNGDGPIIICPAGSVDLLRNYIESVFRLTKKLDVGKPVTLPPHTIIGATIGSSNCSLICDVTRHSKYTVGFESTTFPHSKTKQLKKSGKKSGSGGAAGSSECKSDSDEDSVNRISDSDKIKSMKKPHRIEAIRCNHGGQPTTGYGFIEIREKMKDEFMIDNGSGKRVCKLSQEELREMKANGTIGNLKETVEIPLFAYVCDTDHKVFTNDGHNEGYKLDKYPVIIIECTFFKPEDKKKAKNDKHMHWDNLKEYISNHPEKYFKLMHLSNKYSESDLDAFQGIINAAFPTPDEDTPHVVMLRNKTPPKQNTKVWKLIHNLVSDLTDTADFLEQNGFHEKASNVRQNLSNLDIDNVASELM